MCIAIAKLKGIKAPKEEYLRNSFENNPDGAGYAFNLNGKVEIRKGFMTFDDFWKDYQKMDKKYGMENRGVLYHFRIATHGKVSVACCHPFPVTNNYDEMRKGKITTDFAIIHNGIINLYAKETDDKTSDTMAFTKNVIYPIATNDKWIFNHQNFVLIEKLAASKIAAIDGLGNINLTSQFERAEDGVYYSNDSYSYDVSTYNKLYYDDQDDAFFDYYEKLVEQDMKKSAAVIEVPYNDEEEEYWRLLLTEARYYGITYDEMVDLRNAGWTLEEMEDFVYDEYIRNGHC